VVGVLVDLPLCPSGRCACRSCTACGAPGTPTGPSLPWQPSWWADRRALPRPPNPPDRGRRLRRQDAARAADPGDGHDPAARRRRTVRAGPTRPASRAAHGSRASGCRS
jgi:hypothetical protein